MSSCEKNQLENVSQSLSKAGRPSKYQPEYAEKIIELMRDGCSIKEAAYSWGIARSTIYEWAKKNPEFAEAVELGVEFSEGYWEQHGRKNLYNKDFNSTLWYMNMKNRFGWKDKVDASHTVELKHEDALKELE